MGVLAVIFGIAPVEIKFLYKETIFTFALTVQYSKWTIILKSFF